MGPLTYTVLREPAIRWAWAGKALEGDESGDLHVVAPFPGGVLVAVVDGLGHGPEAATAARAAGALLEAHAGESVLALIQRCHEGLRRTRGAVLSLASFNTRDSSLSWIGVGNVDAVLLRATKTADRPNEAIAVRGGVVGYQLPPLRATAVPVFTGDTLIMSTDGIRSGFSDGVAVENDPAEIAESILTRFAKDSDDALVLVARYLG